MSSLPQDPSAWLAEHGDVLYAYAWKRVKERTIAEDLVQETLLAAVASAERFEGRSAVRTWLVGILRHKILDHLRSSARMATGSDAELQAFLDGRFGPRGKWTAERAPTSWPQSKAERQELAGALEECLERLPPRAAEAFLLRERHGASVERLSQDLATTPTNVWQILSRARAALRECLERRMAGRLP